MGKIRKILVICTGNTCRSPMAEGFLVQRLKPEDGFEIISAGVSAMPGFHPAREAIEVMDEYGIDISSYKSTPLSKDDLNSADLVLVMSDMHKNVVLGMLPEAKNKTFLYTEFAGVKEIKDITDPIGKSISVYKEVRDIIKAATEKTIEKIR